MNIQETIRTLIEKALSNFGVPHDMTVIKLDHPADTAFGDYSTNVAMSLVKSLGATSKNPLDLAQKIVNSIQEELKNTKNFSANYSRYIDKVEAVQPGFINFYLSKRFFADAVAEILEKNVWYGKSTKLWNKKIIVEHTNFNPFKPFHIGHLVNNAIGESLSRMLEFQDAKVSRASYGGDVGLHIAKAMWGMKHLNSNLNTNTNASASSESRHDNTDNNIQTIKNNVEFLGKAYTFGAEAYDTREEAKKEIQILNKKIFDKTDSEINKLYDWGRTVSLNYFKELYKKLDTRFDYSFYESEVTAEGIKMVEFGSTRGVFKPSDGAIIFPGEDYGLHSRVFISSQGLPTYEAKELGLTRRKFEIHDFDESIVVTANEQNEYFNVVLKALSLLYPEMAVRTKHIGHGLLRFASGKMSSRKGNIIAGESLIADVEAQVQEKIHDRKLTELEKKDIIQKVALGAIKYSILKQSVGKDIIFDIEQSVSFEGDSGPYLQYTYVRTMSVLKKAAEQKIKPNLKLGVAVSETITDLEKLLYRFPEIIDRAALDGAPNYIATFLIEVAGAFNSYYAKNKIVDSNDKNSPYKVALTEAVSFVLKNGLYVLGIQVPDKM